MRKNRVRIVSFVAALTLIAGACGSTSVNSTEADNDLSAAISEQNIVGARAVLDNARATWEALEPFAYTLSVGFESINEIEVDFDADGSAFDSRVISGDPEDHSFGELPGTVDEAFSIIEDSIARFETGMYETPESGECGNHFNATFDPVLGTPTYHDKLGPCDDGVGLRLAVTPVGQEQSEIDGPIANEGRCSRADLGGRWVSPGAANISPLQPLTEEDGDGAEVIELLLDDDPATLRTGNTVTRFGEWFCTTTTIFGITEEGEERELATIVDEETLSFDDLTLMRGDEA